MGTVRLPWELGEACRSEGVAMKIRTISLRVVSLHRAHLRVRSGHGGVHRFSTSALQTENMENLPRRGGAHLRSGDGRRVGVHGQLPVHHQQYHDRRLRVQRAALRHRRQERRCHLLGGQQLLHPLHELRAAPGPGQARCLRSRGADPVQRAKGNPGVLPHRERRSG